MNIKKENRVVVFGPDNYNTLGLLRSLGKYDMDLIFLVRGKRGCVTAVSKYCRNIHEAVTDDEAIRFLTQNFAEVDKSKERAILIPGGDSPSKVIAENYNCLYKRFHLMITSDPNVLLRVIDKNEMGRIAQKAGFNVPESQEYRVGVTEFRVKFPVILKPVVYQGRKEFKTKIFNTPEELLKFNKYLNLNNVYVMQQLIKRSNDIIVFGCRLPDGRTVLAGHHFWERWSDDGGGSYGYVTPDIPEYLKSDSIAKFLEIIDYHGLFSAEFGLENGIAYFYEFNLRNDGFTHLTYQAGANLPLLWVNQCWELGLSVPEKMERKMITINEVYDIINVLRGNISYKRYKQDKKEAEVFHFYDKEDMQPYRNMHRRMYWEVPLRAMLKSVRPYIVWLLNKIHK